MRTILFFCTILILPGCATLVSNTKWPIDFDTKPRGATVTITNRRGKEVFKGNTPTRTYLYASAGYFRREIYTVTFSINGYESKSAKITCILNEWYFGNVLLGGVIGMLIIDPATGAMYKLKEKWVDEILEMTKTTSSTGPALNIIDVSMVPEKMKDGLIKL